VLYICDRLCPGVAGQSLIQEKSEPGRGCDGPMLCIVSTCNVQCDEMLKGCATMRVLYKNREIRKGNNASEWRRQ
jgi:hypothetical protein